VGFVGEASSWARSRLSDALGENAVGRVDGVAVVWMVEGLLALEDAVLGDVVVEVADDGCAGDDIDGLVMLECVSDAVLVSTRWF